jgi:hypothetical protein
MLALTSPVGIVRSRTQATEFLFCFVLFCLSDVALDGEASPIQQDIKDSHCYQNRQANIPINYRSELPTPQQMTNMHSFVVVRKMFEPATHLTASGGQGGSGLDAGLRHSSRKCFRCPIQGTGI